MKPELLERQNDPRDRIKQICRFSVGDGSQVLSLNGRLSRLSSKEKTSFLSCLVDELNQNYSNVTHLDLTWNGLTPSNIESLSGLKHVDKLYLDSNDVNGSREQDIMVLNCIKQAVGEVSFYQGMLSCQP